MTGAHLQWLLDRRGSSAASGGEAASRIRRVGVIGAGLMGSGIAHACARAGLDVVMTDATRAVAEAARETIRRREAGRSGGEAAEQRAASVVARIATAGDATALADADLVIEAVFEDAAVKAEVTRAAEAVMREDAIFGTNTSTLPISALARASRRPERFIGLHFFSPVHRMPLVEIIRGERTDAATLAAALAFAEAIGKIPIAVRDGRGFYTTRIVIAYIREANELLAEGTDPALIEEAAIRLGMPLGPLALCDEVALSLMHQIDLQAAKDLGPAFRWTKGATFLGRMVTEAGRAGRKAGAGYYDYPPQGDKRFWPGLAAMAPRLATQPPIDVIRDRLLAVQIVEAIRCLEEGILRSPEDGDIGALLGWSFPEDLGGPFTLVDRKGAPDVLKTCQSLERFGEQFSPPPLLAEMARRGRRFYPT